MKKSVKAGLGIAALGLLANAQEGLAANQIETNKNVREVLGEKKESKVNDSATYFTTATDFAKPTAKTTEKKIEKDGIAGLDVVQTVSLLSDTINALVQSYGEDGVNKKINEIKERYPDFESLSEAKQKEIVMEIFLDKPNSIAATVGEIIIFIWFIRLAIFLSGLSSTTRRKK